MDLVNPMASTLAGVSVYSPVGTLLELDGIVFESPHALAVIGQTSPDRSAPITEVWVGTIPVRSRA